MGNFNLSPTNAVIFFSVKFTFIYEKLNTRSVTKMLIYACTQKFSKKKKIYFLNI
jgi:hypothetical protein